MTAALFVLYLLTTNPDGSTSRSFAGEASSFPECQALAARAYPGQPFECRMEFK